MTETIELSIDSKLEFLDMVSSVTKSVLAKMGFDEESAGWIELAVHEAVPGHGRGAGGHGAEHQQREHARARHAAAREPRGGERERQR